MAGTTARAQVRSVNRQVPMLALKVSHQAFALLLAAALAGCAPIYEGVKSREAATKTPPDATRPVLPSYDDYEAERRRLQRPPER